MSQQPTPPRRGPKPNPASRTNLLEAGVSLFHESGFNGTGIQQIVGAAGLPKGSFYNYFASKDAFGAEAVDAYFERSLADLRSILQDPDLAPLDRLRSYFEQRSRGLRAGGYSKGCLLGNFSLEIGDHSPAIRERLSVHFNAWSELFEACIDDAQQAGEITNPLPASSLAEFTLNAWEGALLRARTTRTDEPLERFIDVTFGVVLT